MATLTQLQTWLSEAESARHAIAMGEGVVDVMRDGRRISYSKRNLTELNGYIAWLETEIEKKTAEADGSPRRRPINLAWHN